ncbi:MAG TPA: hypothetical protein VLH12_08740 [Usitatibacter sp.]|nr:hypothetical protein [Usitatibacter sp.]
MLTAYAQPEKAKSVRLIEAFAQGCGGQVASTWSTRLEPGDAAFYGVRPEWLHLWEQAKAEGRDWYYIDNAYFDCVRERYFRITRNALQCDGLQACWSGDGAARFADLGITIGDWRRDGAHVLVCPQTDDFMRTMGGGDDWLGSTLATLRMHTDRELRVRRKGEKRPLAEDLRGAWALVTHMSCAAVEALVAGVPVFCTGRCAGRWMGTSDLSLIEEPLYPERRRKWAETLAENQFNISEIESGYAWRALTGAGAHV